MRSKITVTTYGDIPDGEALSLAAQSVQYWQAHINQGGDPPAQGLIAFRHEFRPEGGVARTCTRRTLTGWSVIVEEVTEEDNHASV